MKMLISWQGMHTPYKAGMHSDNGGARLRRTTSTEVMQADVLQGEQLVQVCIWGLQVTIVRLC